MSYMSKEDGVSKPGARWSHLEIYVVPYTEYYAENEEVLKGLSAFLWRRLMCP
jgi:hypothetical protein